MSDVTTDLTTGGRRDAGLAGGEVDEVRLVAERIQANVATVIEGKVEIARTALVDHAGR